MTVELYEKILLSLTEERYFVYKHTSPEGKVYIGITRKLPRERWAKGESYKENTDFYADIQKFGWDAFSHEILERGLDEQQALEAEDQFIRQFDCLRPKGYNNRLNRTGQGKGADLSDLECYISAKKDTIKNGIFKAYKEYLHILQPPFTLQYFLEKNVNLPRPAHKEVYTFFPQWVEEINEEHRETILSIQQKMEEYIRWLAEFYNKNNEYITVDEPRYLGTVFNVEDEVYYTQAQQYFAEKLAGNKAMADFLFTILNYCENNQLFNQLIEAELHEDLYKRLENNFVKEAKLTVRHMPLRHEIKRQEQYYIVDLDFRNIYISLFEELMFYKEKNRITFCINNKFRKLIGQVLEDLGAEEISQGIEQFSVADKAQYDSKEKSKIHYRLQNIIKHLKAKDSDQLAFIRKKIGVHYSLGDIRLDELERKLWRVENICSHKQEKFIEHLLAGHGFQLKNKAIITRGEAQFLITNLQAKNAGVLEKFADRFEEF